MADVMISESTVRQLATANSYERGRSYFEDGWVLSVVKRGNIIQAEVEGSEYEPYRITVELGAFGIESTDCTCPYDWGGICKHIVATLLAYINGAAEERPSIATLLAQIDASQAVELLKQIVTHHPDVVETIEAYLEQQTRPPAAKPSVKASHLLKPEPFRKQAQQILRSVDRMYASEAYWYAGNVVRELGKMVEQAWGYVKSGDGHNALVILEALTDAYVDVWFNFDDSDGEAGDFYNTLGPVWCEALLTADLTPEERDKWADRLEGWQETLIDYGIEDAFDASLAAAIQGWDAPLLQQVLRGEAELKSGERISQSWYAAEITQARLNILARQERYEEYLNFAAAEGQSAAYAAMLVTLERVDEAVAYGLVHFKTATEAMTLAEALFAKGRTAQAFKIAEHGLTLGDDSYATALTRLSLWLRDTAYQMGHKELAGKTAVIAFQKQPSLTNYLAIQTLVSAQDWVRLKQEQLEILLRQPDISVEDRIDIFLHERLADDAVRALQKASYIPYETFKRVADVALESHSVWVINVSQQQAEAIMNDGKSKYYQRALNWLKLSKAAHLANGEVDVWQAYHNGLLKKHSRKYSLMPGLKAL